MNLLEVDDAELIAIGGELAAPTGNARNGWRERRAVAVRLTSEELVGWGECAPLPGVSPDRLDDATAALAGLLGGELPRLDLDDPFRSIAAWVGTLPASLPSARFALETALLDLCARAYECPVGALIGETTTSLAASTLIDLEDWRETLPTAITRHYTTVKIKIGRRLDVELAELAALRAEHPDVVLRLDANGALRSSEVDGALAAFAAFAPEWIEQPVAPGLLAALGTPPCPIAADESAAADDDDLWQAVHRGIVSVLVIKPAVVGGIVRAAELAERARAVGLDVVISHLLDGPIALAACAELACALGGTRAAGLGPHIGLTAFPTVRVPQLVAGTLRSVGPGLGVELE